MSKLHIIDHPLILHKLSIIRDKDTGVKEFRELVSEVEMCIRDRFLPLKKKSSILK